MESVSKIRRWILVEGRSIRSVARATGLSRNTIKKYLKDASPPSYQRQAPPARHKLCDGFDTRLQELFEQDQKRPPRERRTATRCRVALNWALPQFVWRNGSILARSNSGPARPYIARFKVFRRLI